MEFKFILKKLNNSLTEAEDLMFSEWYNESAKHKQYFDNVKENYSKDIELIDIEKGWNSLTQKLNYKSKSIAYWKYTAVAAGIALLIGVPFLLNKIEPSSGATNIIVNEIIEPGTNKATLTLENGTHIALEKGEQYTSDHLISNGEELVYQTSQDKKVEIAYNYLTVPRAGEFYVKLSDGTQIWLNSESQIKYPVAFLEGEPRQVELVYGEAYFNVSPSTNHRGAKFEVLTGEQEIEVLGTEFNVKAYKDEEHIYTTLVEGKVAVKNDLDRGTLKPDEQSILNINTNSFVITKADTYSEIAWKRGLFSFKNKSLKNIMKVLSRWYDVDIVFVDKELENIEFKGVLSKNQNIEDILNLIKNTKFIKAYEIKDNAIILKN